MSPRGKREMSIHHVHHQPQRVAAPAATVSTQRTTRSLRKPFLAPATSSTAISKHPRISRSRVRKADSSSRVAAITRAVQKASKLRTPALPLQQSLGEVIEQAPSPRRTRKDPIQLIRSWAVEIEGIPASQSSLHSNSEVDTDDFWKKRGYERPKTSTASISSSLDGNQTTQSESKDISTARKSKSQKAEKDVTIVNAGDKKFPFILMEHNININPELTPDKRLVELKKIALRNYPRGLTAYNSSLETRWRHDMSKCKLSNEAMFQRTIMMDMIGRYELNEQLDFICETSWSVDRMPRRNNSIELAQPKPDLAVAFKTISLLPAGYSPLSLMRLGKITGHIWAEGLKKGGMDRAFHFFSIEVKGKYSRIRNTRAEYQNLNTAAQALHNIYIVMSEAELEHVFFEEVRFFSIVATVACFELRVHRPMRLGPDDHIDGAYGVRFSFDEVLTVRSDYTKAMASTVVYNILFHYGVEKLCPVLRAALEVVLGKHRGVATGTSTS